MKTTLKVSSLIITTHENGLEIVLAVSDYSFDGVPSRGMCIFAKVIHLDCEIDTVALFDDSQHITAEVVQVPIPENRAPGYETYIINFENGGKIRLCSKPLLIEKRASVCA